MVFICEINVCFTQHQSQNWYKKVEMTFYGCPAEVRPVNSIDF